MSSTRVDRDACAADLALGDGVVGVVAELRREVEGNGETGLAACRRVWKRAFVSSAEPNPAYWRIVHAGRGTCPGYGPRVNGNWPGRPPGPAASSGP